MQFPHLFEVMDQSWPPASLHATMREILECGNSKPFRPYYQWVADEVASVLAEGEYDYVVELGAGTAPISRLLAKKPGLDGVKMIVCDDHPDAETFGDLQRQYPDKIVARNEPVDFSKPQEWPPRTLLLLSGAFHHIPPALRREVLENLTKSAQRVMVCEPLRKAPVSMIFVPFSIFPAMLLPIWFFGRPGKLRRMLWCWLAPIAPVIFWWDGLVSCLRMWTDSEWKANLQELLPTGRKASIGHSLFCQMVTWVSPTKPDPQPTAEVLQECCAQEGGERPFPAPSPPDEVS